MTRDQKRTLGQILSAASEVMSNLENLPIRVSIDPNSVFIHCLSEKLFYSLAASFNTTPKEQPDADFLYFKADHVTFWLSTRPGATIESAQN